MNTSADILRVESSSVFRPPEPRGRGTSRLLSHQSSSYSVSDSQLEFDMACGRVEPRGRKRDRRHLAGFLWAWMGCGALVGGLSETRGFRLHVAGFPLRTW